MGTPQRDEKSGGYRLHVGGIGEGVSEDEVRGAFDKVGQIKELWLSNAEQTPRFGFIVFEDQTEAENAIQNISGTDLNGSSLRVAWAKPREDRRGGGGRGGKCQFYPLRWVNPVALKYLGRFRTELSRSFKH